MELESPRNYLRQFPKRLGVYLLGESSLFLLLLGRSLKRQQKQLLWDLHQECHQECHQEEPSQERGKNDPLRRSPQISLDHWGRAIDLASGEYLRGRPDKPAPPGQIQVGLGGTEGLFLTLNSEGELVPWIPPPGYLAN